MTRQRERTDRPLKKTAEISQSLLSSAALEKNKGVWRTNDIFSRTTLFSLFRCAKWGYNIIQLARRYI